MLLVTHLEYAREPVVQSHFRAVAVRHVPGNTDGAHELQSKHRTVKARAGGYCAILGPSTTWPWGQTHTPINALSPAAA